MPQFDPDTDFMIPVRTAQGPTHVAVRYPKDEEWAEWYRLRKTMITSIGRGQSTWEPDDTDADSKLYDRIHGDGAPALDPYEAHNVVEILRKFEVRDMQSEGEELIITALVMGGEVTHRIRIPFAKQVALFRKASGQVISLPFNRSQVKSRMEPGARLWEECMVSTTGYLNGFIPGIHKDEAIRAVVQFVENEADERNP